MKMCSFSTLVPVLVLQLCASDARAFLWGLGGDNQIHQRITREALNGFVGVVHDGGNTYYLKFLDETAKKEIIDWDVDTDIHYSGLAEAHWDNHSFYDASARLQWHKIIVLDALKSGLAQDARKHLGHALHTVQDFYAHSNWIELYGSGINLDLGRRTMNPDRGNVCEETICGVPHVYTWPCDDHEVLGRRGLPGAVGGSLLTTGWYYRSAFYCSFGVPDGQVIHGYSHFYPQCSGLNKDSSDRPGYTDARLAAVNATKDYLQQIFDELDVAEVKMLVGGRSSIGMVVDTSERMSQEIGYVKTMAHNLTFQPGTTAFFLLKTFNQKSSLAGRDPSTWFDRDAFIQQGIDPLATVVGGACPTVGNQALLSALDGSEPGADLYFFSNGSSKPSDEKLAGNVSSLAATKKVSIIRLVTGACPTSPPCMVCLHDNSDKIGGLVFLTTPDALTNVSGILNAALAGNIVPGLSVSGTLTTNGIKDFIFPVDSTVSNVTFLVSGDNTNATISFITPSGTNLVQGQLGVTITEIGTGRTATIPQPELGDWRIRFNGAGHFAARAQINTPLTLNRFAFVEIGGNADHPGYVAVPGQPVGAANTALAHVVGNYSDVSFKLVTPDGEFIQSLDLTEDVTNAPGEFVGTVALPTEPFKVVVTGLDTNGFSFQRTYPPIFQVQPIEVRSLQLDAPQLIPGVPCHVRYLVSNLGVTGVLNVSIAAGNGVVTNVSLETLTLATGETNIVEADIVMPADADTNVSEFITAVVSREDDPNCSNSAVDRADVVAPSANFYSSTVLAFHPAGYWPLNETVVPPSAQYVVTNLGLAGADGNGCYMTWWQPFGIGLTNFYLTNSIQHTSGAIGDGDAAAVFGTSGQYVVFQRHPGGRLNGAITIQPPFSIEVWANGSNTIGGVRGIVSEGRAATQGGTNNNYANVAAGVFLGQSGGSYVFDVYYTNGVAGHTPELHIPVATNTWQHLVATFDGTNANFYNNGRMVQTADYSAQVNDAGEVFVPDPISPLLIGCGPGLNSGLFQGMLDEVAIYASALPAEEVLAHYDAGTNAAPPTPYQQIVLNTNPVVYVRLDEPAWGSNGTTLTSLSLPVATNYGTAGPAANGVYQPNTTPGVEGPPFAGFGSASYGVAINGFNAAVDVGGGNLANTAFDPHDTNAQFTVMTWFKPNPGDTQVEGQAFMGHGSASWRLYDNSGLNRFSPGDGPSVGFGTGLQAATNGFQINDGQWHFVAGVCDGTTAYLYLDGRLALTRGSPVGSIAGSGRDIILGGDPQWTTPGSGFFDGAVAQAAFFTNALTAANIQTLYAAGVTGPVLSSAHVSITSVVRLATNPARFAFGGTGGVPYGIFYVLTSTNIATPPANWSAVATNFFDGSGGFSVTNDLSLGEPARFFLLKGP